ncbi:MAG: hypothetical protein ACR2G3_12760 [Solirubrobacterales bacterium]
MTRLAGLNLLLVALLVAHTLDHGLNQPARDVPPTGTAIALAGFLALAVSSVLALRRSPLAPAAALLAGGATVLGLIIIHLLPGWWDLVSDPYWDFDANALSWALALAPLAAGFLLALVGARALPGRSAQASD